MYIADFESVIEAKIFARGKKYFTDGLVADIWMPTQNCYHAVVEGGTPYDVELHLGQSGEILQHYCDCPYDWGEYCKHEVAVLLAIRRHLEQNVPIKKHGQKRGLHALLHKLTKDELINLLYELTVKYDLREDIVDHLEGFHDESDDSI